MFCISLKVPLKKIFYTWKKQHAPGMVFLNVEIQEFRNPTLK